MNLKILYFAWIRERIGKAEEEIELPASVTTAGELIEFLRGKGEEYALAFGNPKIVRVALDKVHVQSAARIGAAREIALFPPMTGG
jgi:molybdopterin synthase sulfur carrier subunit